MAAIAIPRLGGFRDSAATEAVNASIRTVEGAAAMYHAQNGSFPGNVSDLVPNYLTENPFTSDPAINTTGADAGKVVGTPVLK